jgi:hypothetical protein
MMGFTFDHGKKRRDVLDLVIHHTLEHCGIPAKRDRGKIDEQITGRQGFGDQAIIIVHVAYAGGTDPAEEITGAVAYFLFTQVEVFHIPASGFEFGLQSSMDAFACAIVFF